MKRNPYLLWSLGISFLIGALLWFKSDPPPYGYPNNELSNFYWGIIVDIGHKWRSGQFSLWDQGVAGGTSLFTSGEYPIFSPSNIFAAFLSDDQFYLYKIIEPYVLGVFLGLLFFRKSCRLQWPYALFGAFYFMGLAVGRQANMANFPFFILGCALFPAIVMCFRELPKKSIYLTAAAVGSLIACQFGMAGVFQIPQVLIWCILFLMMELNLFWPARPYLASFKRFVTAACVLVFMACGILGIQFIPTLQFAFLESVRAAGQYSMNNFPLFISPDANAQSLAELIYNSFVFAGGVSMVGVLALILICLGLLVFHSPSGIRDAENTPFLLKLWGTTALFFSIPTLAAGLTTMFPGLAGIFHPLKTFHFKYGTHIFDFCMAMTISVILNNAHLAVGRNAVSPGRAFFGWTFLVGALFIALIPAISFFPSLQSAISAKVPLLAHLILGGRAGVLLVLIIVVSMLGYVIFRPANRWAHGGLTFGLALLGFMTMVTCLHWNNKGQQSHLAAYGMDDPEYQYFRSAKGEYYFPYHATPRMRDNYSLLYGVHGITSFLDVPPERISKFSVAYHHETGDITQWKASILTFRNPSDPLNTYFPVTFTTVEHGQPLPYTGFVKQVSGREHDIWTREVKPPPVRFAHQVSVVDFKTLIKKFDTPFKDTLWIDRDDAGEFVLQETVLSKGREAPSYRDYQRPRGDRIQFTIDAPEETFVVLGDMFQKGWNIHADGKKIEPFPANYLFIGFRLPAGEHQMTLRFSPPGMNIGALLNILSAALLLGLLLRSSKHSQRKEGLR